MSQEGDMSQGDMSQPRRFLSLGGGGGAGDDTGGGAGAEGGGGADG